MLTNITLAAMKPREAEYMVNDSGGLSIRVRPTGVMHWVFQKMIKGRRVKRVLGAYPEMSLKEARERRDLIAIQEEQENIDKTFGGIFERWKALRASQIIHFRDIELRFERYLLPKFGSAKMAEIKVPTVIAVLQEIAKEDKLETVKRLCMYLKQMELFAVNYGLIEVPRFQGISSVFPSPKVKNRPSVPPEELPMVFEHFLKYPGLSSLAWDVVRTGFFTLLRPGEYTRMRWSWIHDGAINVPAEVMKMKKAHRVPISTQLGDLLEQRPKSSVFVFPAPRNRNDHFGQDSLPMFFKRAGLSGLLVPHGVRSIGRTWMAEKRIDFAAAEMCLAHTVGSATVQAYDRSDLFEQRIEIMQKWSDFVEEAINKVAHPVED